MKRVVILFATVLLLTLGTPVHAALIANDSFENATPVRTGYVNDRVWYTDGFGRGSDGGSDGNHYAAAIDSNPADYKFPAYDLFQVVKAAWPSGTPGGDVTLDLYVDYKMHEEVKLDYFYLALDVVGKNSPPPSQGSTKLEHFGDLLFKQQRPDSTSYTDWSTEHVRATVAPYDYYTVYITGSNADVDNVTLTVGDAVPVPAPPAVLLLGSGLMGLISLRKRRSA